MRRAQATADGSSSSATTRACGTSSATGQRDGPGAGAQVDDEHLLGAVRDEPAGDVDPEPGEELGLGPGHEDPRPDGELDAAEARGTGEVLQRHPAGARVDEPFEGLGLRGGQDLPEDDPARHLAAWDAEHVGDEQLGVGRRRGDPGRGEPVDGRRERRPQRQPDGGAGGAAAHDASVAASRAASSSVTQDPTTGSRSPASTWSRL